MKTLERMSNKQEISFNIWHAKYELIISRSKRQLSLIRILLDTCILLSKQELANICLISWNVVLIPCINIIKRSLCKAVISVLSAYSPVNVLLQDFIQMHFRNCKQSRWDS